MSAARGEEKVSACHCWIESSKQLNEYRMRNTFFISIPNTVRKLKIYMDCQSDNIFRNTIVARSVVKQSWIKRLLL